MTFLRRTPIYLILDERPLPLVAAFLSSRLLLFDQSRLSTSPKQWPSGCCGMGESESIADLTRARDEARARKDWATADLLRGRLAAAGVSLSDAKATSGKQSKVKSVKVDAATKRARQRATAEAERAREAERSTKEADAKKAASKVAREKASKRRKRPDSGEDDEAKPTSQKQKRILPASRDPVIAQEDAAIKALEEKLGLGKEKDRAKYGGARGRRLARAGAVLRSRSARQPSRHVTTQGG